jgi:hypothetical protein
MNLITEFLSTIREQLHLNLLELNLDSKFSSNQTQHRRLIREDILRNFQSQLSSEEISSIQDLDSFPKTEKIFFSISHNQELGGYSVAGLKHGFDIELKSRISAPIIQRVSTANELSIAPDIKLIWCAKEAAFKALSAFVFTVSDFEVIDWSPQNESQNETGLWTYRITSKKTLEQTHNIGFVFQDSTQIYSIYFL